MAARPPRKPNVQHFYPVDIVEIPKQSQDTYDDDDTADSKQPRRDEASNPDRLPVYTPPPTEELEKHVIVMPSLHVETSSQWMKLLWNWVDEGISRGDDVWKGDHLGEIGLDKGGFVDQTNFRDYLKYIKDSKLQRVKNSKTGSRSSDTSPSPFPFSFSNFDKIMEQPGEKRALPLMRPPYWDKLSQHGKDVVFEEKLSEWSAWNFSVLKKKMQADKYKDRESMKLNTVVHGSDFHIGQVERVMSWAIGPRQATQEQVETMRKAQEEAQQEEREQRGREGNEDTSQENQQPEEREASGYGQAFRGNMAWGNMDKFDRALAGQSTDTGQPNISDTTGNDPKSDNK